MSEILDNSECSREHGMRVGDVDFIDWDLAVVEHIGGVLEPADPVDPTEPGKNMYFLPLEGIFVKIENQRYEIDRAQIVHKRPEPSDVQLLLPSVVVSMEDVSPAINRLLGVTEQYRIPAEGAQSVAVDGCIGYSHYESKDQADPYDFSYSIEVWSRYRAVAKMMLGILMKRFPVRGHTSVGVLDSEGCRRQYLAILEGISDLTEVNSLVDRVVGYGLNVRIEGELTNANESFVATAFTGETSLTPDTGDPTVPGTDLYGTGAADVELCFKGKSYLLSEDEVFPA